jgi:hypothetical protein
MLHTFTFFNEDISIFAEAVAPSLPKDHPIDAKVVESLNKKLTIPGGNRLLTTAELQVIVSAMAVLEFHGWEIKANRAAEAVINDNRCEESAKGSRRICAPSTTAILRWRGFATGGTPSLNA